MAPIEHQNMASTDTILTSKSLALNMFFIITTRSFLGFRTSLSTQSSSLDNKIDCKVKVYTFGGMNE
jgi:hypothetical protein